MNEKGCNGRIVLAACFIFAIAALCAYLLKNAGYPFWATDEDTKKTEGSGASVIRQVVMGFSIRNSQNTPVVRPVFLVRAPVLQTNSQRCEKIQASYDYELLKADYGNQILKFILPVVPPFGTANLNLRFWVSISEPSGSDTKEKMNIFLEPEPYIESDSPAIRTLAQRLRTESEAGTVRRIFNWVKNNISYTGPVAKPAGALNALKLGKGDCTEFMCLFTALCRADGIPARGVSGFIAHKNGKLNSAMRHDWAEFFSGDRWHLADPQRGVFDSNYADYIAFQVIRGNSRVNPTVDENGKQLKTWRFYSVNGKGLRVRFH